jgi:hypothetical protein
MTFGAAAMTSLKIVETGLSAVQHSRSAQYCGKELRHYGCLRQYSSYPGNPMREFLLQLHRRVQPLQLQDIVAPRLKAFRIMYNLI